MGEVSSHAPAAGSDRPTSLTNPAFECIGDLTSLEISALGPFERGVKGQKQHGIDLYVALLSLFATRLTVANASHTVDMAGIFCSQ